MAHWAEVEFAAADLGDQRLNRRLVRLATQLGAAPAASLPEACRGAAETKAAYRFFAQPECDWRALLAPHWACTQTRMAAEARVLCVQDTTELDFTTQPGVAGLGRLSHDARHGMYVHPTLAVTPAGVALGVLDAWMWARAARGQAAPKESTRWLEGYERVAELAASLPGTRLVYLADRESDIRALMDRAAQLGTPADWLVRAAHNRALEDGAKLWARLAQTPALGEVSFVLPALAGRAARTVVQEVRCVRVTLPDRGQGERPVTAIEARERNAPTGCKAVLWRLLTNEPVEGLEEACERIDWYRRRWWVEVFFRILKSGCRVEALQLSSVARLERALAVYLVVAWRVLQMSTLGREAAQASCECLFSTEEWQAAWIVRHRRAPPPTAPSLDEMVHWVAGFGGYLGRKCDGEPGPKALWAGLSYLAGCIEGIRASRAAALGP